MPLNDPIFFQGGGGGGGWGIDARFGGIDARFAAYHLKGYMQCFKA